MLNWKSWKIYETSKESLFLKLLNIHLILLVTRTLDFCKTKYHHKMNISFHFKMIFLNLSSPLNLKLLKVNFKGSSKDMKKLPSSNNFVSTDMAKNLYKISKENYNKLLYYKPTKNLTPSAKGQLIKKPQLLQNLFKLKRNNRIICKTECFPYI